LGKLEVQVRIRGAKETQIKIISALKRLKASGFFSGKEKRLILLKYGGGEDGETFGKGGEYLPGSLPPSNHGVIGRRLGDRTSTYLGREIPAKKRSHSVAASLKGEKEGR